MALKSVVANLDGIPEALRGEYVESPGVGFVLALEGDHPTVLEHKANVKSFRENNISLKKEVDGLKAQLAETAERYKDIDPAKAREASARIADLERAGVGRGEDVNALVARQVKAATDPLIAALDGIKREKEEAAAALARKTVEGSLRDVAQRVGVNDKATADFIRRGLDVFNLEGKAMEGGEPRFSRKHPSQPLSMEEWALDLQAEAPHLFTPSQGGGARGGEGGRTGGPRLISSDPLEVGRNLEDLAAGKVAIAQ